MKIDTFNRTNLTFLRTAIDEALKSVAEKYGVDLKMGNASFTSNTVKFKVEGATVNENGVSNNDERETFKKYAGIYGLTQDMLDASMVINGTLFKIDGLKMSSKKYPVTATKVDNGKRYKLSASMVKMGTKLATTPA